MKKKATQMTDLQWVGAKLRAIRLARGLRLQDAADRMGAGHSRISDTESGRHDLKLSTLLRTLDALGTTANDFFSDKPRHSEIGDGCSKASRARRTRSKSKAE